MVCDRVERLVAANAGSTCLARPKSRIFDMAVGGDEDVVRLQVAMDDAAGVGGAETGDELKRQLCRPWHGQRPAFEERAQRVALEQLGDEERHVADADVEDREDVRVRQRGDGARLLLEAAKLIGIGGTCLRDHLDRDVAAEPRIAGAVDLTHAAGTERRHESSYGPRRLPELSGMACRLVFSLSRNLALATA